MSVRQMDFVEAMERDDDGLFKRHCVDWGWSGVACSRATNIIDSTCHAGGYRL